jgi:copper(I)-binding protein
MDRPACRSWLSVAALGTALALATPGAATVFVVTEPWVRVAPNGQEAEIYMELHSSEAARIVAVRAEGAAVVAFRAPSATQAPIAAIPLPAGATVKLAANSFRIAMPKLSRPLKLGDRVAVVLTIEAEDGKRQEIPATAEVRRRSPTDDHRRAHAH